MLETFPWILHIDGDGFFAYCEIARFPHLKGSAVVVGEERGIACAMTYEAKRLGITRGMPIFKIREQFPSVTILPCHFELYEHYAHKLALLIEPDLDILERYSIDECFGLIHLPAAWDKKDMAAWLQKIKGKVQGATGLTYSFGLARTKVLAKVASKYQKPDGCTIILPHDEDEILQHTKIQSIWGIGWRLGRRFETMHLTSAYEFKQWDELRVQKHFATPIQELWHELNGRSMFGVTNSDSLPKSLQSTKSFTPCSTDPSFVIAELLQNTDIVFTRMRRHGLATNAVSIFLKTTARHYTGIPIALPHYTSNPIDVARYIVREANILFVPSTRYKSTGITVWNLRPQSRIQTDLFGAQEIVSEDGNIMQSVDAIRKRYGHMSIGLLASLPSTIDRLGKHKARRATDHYQYGLPLPYMGEVF